MPKVGPPNPLVQAMMEVRFQRGWSRERWAAAAGVSLREVAGLEDGLVRSPGVKVLERLGWALGYDLEWTHADAA